MTFLKKIKTSNSNGFTLLEVLIALSILSIGILAVAKMQLSSTGGNASSRGLTEAAAIGQLQLERLLSTAYDDPILADTNGDGTDQDADDDGVDDDGGNFGLDETAAPDNSVVIDTVYNVMWNVADDEPIANVKKIKVIVRWQSSGNAIKEISFDTVKVSM